MLPLSDEYLKQCEYAARRFSGAYTGTSGSLAAMLLHCLDEIRTLRAELSKERDDSTPWWLSPHD